MSSFFSCERPWAFYGLLFLLPPVILTIVRYLRFAGKGFSLNGAFLGRVRRILVARLIWWGLAWIFLVMAFSGISWGTELKAVNQSGSSLAFVFDVSHSMTAQDVGGKQSLPVSRLDASVVYARGILDRLDGVDVSAVIAKGDGLLAVPQTSDKNAVYSLLSSLSPQLMTSAGSSIGSGISAAAASFPALSVAARTILVFTDGEETDGAMAKAAEEAVQSGIQLVFLGFGSEDGTEVLAGDGETVVHTALRAKALQDVVDSVNALFANASRKQRLLGLGATSAQAVFVPAQQTGSARLVLDMIQRGNSSQEVSGTVYEVRGVPRWRLFCVLSVLCLVLGFVWAELDFSRFRSAPPSSAKTVLLLAVLFSGILFQGCSASWDGVAGILEGTFRWYRKDFRGAVASFMQTTEYAQGQDDSVLAQYGLYGLASTYLAQGESDAALARFNEISPDAPEGLRFSSLYNAGIVAYRKGKYDDAASCFRQALFVDGTSIDAKINLELSLRQASVQADEASQELMPAHETQSDSMLENTIFSLIREKEQDKWKNQQSQEKSDSALDY